MSGSFRLQCDVRRENRKRDVGGSGRWGCGNGVLGGVDHRGSCGRLGYRNGKSMHRNGRRCVRRHRSGRRRGFGHRRGGCRESVGNCDWSGGGSVRRSGSGSVSKSGSGSVSRSGGRSVNRGGRGSVRHTRTQTRSPNRTRLDENSTRCGRGYRRLCAAGRCCRHRCDRCRVIRTQRRDSLANEEYANQRVGVRLRSGARAIDLGG